MNKKIEVKNYIDNFLDTEKALKNANKRENKFLTIVTVSIFVLFFYMLNELYILPSIVNKMINDKTVGKYIESLSKSDEEDDLLHYLNEENVKGRFYIKDYVINSTGVITFDIQENESFLENAIRIPKSERSLTSYMQEKISTIIVFDVLTLYTLFCIKSKKKNVGRFVFITGIAFVPSIITVVAMLLFRINWGWGNLFISKILKYMCVVVCIIGVAKTYMEKQEKKEKETKKIVVRNICVCLKNGWYNILTKTVRKMNDAFFYDYSKLWFKLSLMNLVAIYLIIRGSSVPLLFDNQIFRLLFYSSKNEDKTLYNIAISFLAAYIFYLIQIYVPEKKQTKNAVLSIYVPLKSMIMWIFRFLFVCDYYRKEGKPGQISEAQIETVYIKNDVGFVYKVDRENFEDMVDRVKKEYEKIVSDPLFQNCDYSLRRLLLETNIAAFIRRLHEIILEAEALESGSDIAIGYPEDEIYCIKKQMYLLMKILKIEVSTNLTITENEEDIKTVERNVEKFRKALEKNKAFCEILAKHNEL